MHLSRLYTPGTCCTVFTRVAQGTSSTGRRRQPAGRGTSGATRIARWAVVFFAVAVIVDAIVGDRGLLAMLRARQQYDRAAAALEQQRAENVRLREEVSRLTNDPAAIEELARGELGLMRPGEKLFIVKDLKAPAAR
jgi:cell division protein FtsB